VLAEIALELLANLFIKGHKCHAELVTVAEANVTPPICAATGRHRFDIPISESVQDVRR